MPIYEYHCESCDRDFEYLVIGSQEPEGCPHCHSTELCRRLSVCGFVTKGSGGQTVRSSASSCSGCTAGSCSSCGH